MSKITKKLMDEYLETKKIVQKSKYSHQQNINKIIDIIKPLIDGKYVKNPCHHNITDIEFLYDENMKKSTNTPMEYEWIKISEKEYYDIYNANKKDSFFRPINIKEEDIFEPEYDCIYYKEAEKRKKYLRVYVHESWGYGGNDDVSFDFLLSDIVDDQYLRKEKLQKLSEMEESE